MPHTKSPISKKLLLAGLGIVLLVAPLILSIPKDTLDTRNYAQEASEADIVPAVTSGKIPVNQPYDIPLNIVKTSTRAFTISGAQVEIGASSVLSFNKDQIHCNSPFIIEYKSINTSANTLKIVCSIPQGQPALNVPDGASISFANINLTFITENSPISPRIFFNKKKVIEAGIPNDPHNLSGTKSIMYDYSGNVNAQGAPPQTPSPVPTFVGAACDLCGWCPPEDGNPKPGNWNECNSCLYEADQITEKKGAYYTIIGCLSTDKAGAPFMQSALGVVFGVAGGFAFLAVLIGAVIVLTSSGNPTHIQTGKDLIFSAIIGLLLILFSVFILRVVGFDVLRIPGVG